MASETSITGAVQLSVQALDNNSNQVLFNKQILGLQCPTDTQAGYYETALSDIDTAITNTGLTLSGLFIKNNAASGAPDIVTVKWTPLGGIQATIIGLSAQSAIFLFFANNQALQIVNPQMSSSVIGTNVEVAYWI